VSEADVAEWVKEHPEANVALHSDGSWIGIDPDAYDGKIGDQTLAALERELGELPATISSTARGEDSPSRIYFFSVPMGRRFVTKFTDLEIIQQSHRYAVCAPSIHPKTGTPYAWYGYEGELLDEVPSVGDMEMLPEAWLDRLTLPDFDGEEGAGFSGSVSEWLERVPQGSPGLFMTARMNEVPKSNFGHDVMVSLQASFVAMAAKGETGVREALAHLRSEWLRGEFNTPDYERDFNTSLKTAIAKFGALPGQAADILSENPAAIYARVGDKELLDTWTGLPVPISAESIRERTARVMSLAYEGGATTLEAAVLGWHSAAAQEKQYGLQREGVEAVWDLAVHVATHPVTAERTFVADVVDEVPAAEVSEEVQAVQRRIPLLTEAERERVSNIDWWGEEYIRVMTELHNGLLSVPYYRLNRWMLLSLCFADVVAIPLGYGDRIILNFYGVMTGPSNTGKTESLEPIIEFVRQFYLGAETSPNLGSDATPEALTVALHRQMGTPSILHMDEADAKFRKWSEPRGPYSGMPQLITQVYTGRTPKQQRNTQRETSNLDTPSHLNVHMMGIEHKIAEAIHPDDWVTGYVNRFVWCRGERIRPTREQRKVQIGAPTPTQGRQRWFDQWNAQFRAIKSSFSHEPGEEYSWIDASEDVRERDLQTQDTFHAIANSSSYAERLEPTFKRLETTIFKCAALIAITKKRRRIEMDDYLVALEQAEEWAENILDMVAATDVTPRAREVNKLYELLESNNGRMPLSAIHRHGRFQGEQKYTNGLIEELTAQGRAEKLPLPDGQVVIRIMKEGTK
jgi:hypothetical protein